MPEQPARDAGYSPSFPNFPEESRVFAGFGKSQERRSSSELCQLLEGRDVRKIKEDILDETGSKICSIEYDPETRDIISIISEPYTNVEGTAEHPEERIYVTDEKGQITPERLTRKEARDGKRQYLIVTSLIFRGDTVLIQKRSAEKKFDAGKLSSSAHGVAKEIFSKDGVRVTDAQTAALVNTVLEINEELRHSENPFVIRIWPGTHDELFSWAEETHFDDPDTIWLVPEAYLSADGYNLGRVSERRTRAFSAGFIFSSNEPRISIDPSELEECRWQKASEVFREPNAADDLSGSMSLILKEMLQDSPLVRKYGQKIVRNLLRRYQGLEIDKP